MLSLVAAQLVLFGAPHPCSKLDNDAARLACFDKAFPAASPEGSAGQWEVTGGVSEFTDKATLTAQLLASSGSALTLRVVCTGEVLAVAISAPGEVLAKQVTLRFDQDKHSVDKWHSSPTSSGSLFLVGSTSSIAIHFLYQLSTHDELLLSLSSYGNGPLTSTFRPKGFGALAAEFKKACPAWTGGATTKSYVAAREWWSRL